MKTSDSDSHTAYIERGQASNFIVSALQAIVQDSPTYSSLEVLSRTLNCGLILLDDHTQLEFTNRCACEVLGCSSEEDLKRRWEMIKPLLRLNSALPSLPNPHLFRIDLPVNGERRGLRVAIHVLERHFGRSILVLIKNRLKLDALQTQLLIASQMRAQLYIQSALAHAVRTPLNAMHLTLELLSEVARESTLNPSLSTQQHSITVLKEELAKTNRSLRYVLNHDELRNPTPQLFDLCDLVEEVVSLLNMPARYSLLHIKLHLPDYKIKLTGQRGWLKQALLNITINRLEAMSNRGCLDIDVQLDNSTVNIVIKDQGPHLSEAELENIYAVAFTAATDTQGLDLYLTRVLVEVLGGEVQVVNLSGKGSCLILSLPLTHED